jgi:hypothetical protein
MIPVTIAAMSALADLRSRMLDVRFTPQSGHAQRPHRCLLSAISGHKARPSVASLIAWCEPRLSAMGRDVLGFLVVDFLERVV